MRGVPDRRCSLREIAALAASPLESEWRHETTRAIGSFGFHLSVVGVDVTTGEVHPETHFVLCDVGRALNPAIVEGQLVGAVIQGIGHATMEELVYDSSGQLLTGTFMDYAMPTAARVPAVELLVHESAAASNPLGVKGAGEAGTSGVGAAVANAVAAAVGSAAARHVPVTAPRVKAALLSPLLSAVQMLLVAIVLVACSVASTPVEPIDASLREEARRVAVPETDSTIVVTSYRPRAWGPLPWIVMSHGTAPTPEANRTIGRYRSLNPIREWVRRGYAVVVPVRRGYGASGGDKFGDSYGSCNRPDFRRAGEGAAAGHSRRRAVGQDAERLRSEALAARRDRAPAGSPRSHGVEAPRRGSSRCSRSRPAAADGRTRTRDYPARRIRVAKLFASIAPQIAVPVLWFYAENDEYIGPRPRQSSGSRASTRPAGAATSSCFRRFPTDRGHGVYPSAAGTPLWTAAVATFFHAHQIALPF